MLIKNVPGSLAKKIAYRSQSWLSSWVMEHPIECNPEKNYLDQPCYIKLDLSWSAFCP